TTRSVNLSPAGSSASNYHDSAQTIDDDIARLNQYCWPGYRLAEALEALVRNSNLSNGPIEKITTPPMLAEADNETIGHWLDAAALTCGIEAEPVESSYDEIEELLYFGAPALLRLPGGRFPRFLAIAGQIGSTALLIGSDLKIS